MVCPLVFAILTSLEKKVKQQTPRDHLDGIERGKKYREQVKKKYQQQKQK